MLRSSQNSVVSNARRSFMIVLIAAAIACLSCAPLVAQVTSGTIFGTVKDPTGAMVKGATVTISDPSNGLTRTVTTSDSGGFSAPGLYPGTYTITIEAKGFKKMETTGIVLSAADKLNAGDFLLTVGTTSEEVTVSADAGQIQLQSNSGERSDLITSKQLNDVAMNGRNVLDYMKLIPGVVGTADLHRSGTGHISDFNINGTRGNQHEFTIDGASNVDTGDNGGTHVTLNTDAIEEVKILTSNYQAEFGKAAGGQIAVTTKSGTNQWHGNARFFHRNEGLNANEYFNIQAELKKGAKNSPPLYRYNDIGYQFGGPIKKDKVFFFWSQEFFRQRLPVSGTEQFYTPTAAERMGDFSKSTDEQANPVTISGPGITNNVINPNDPNFPAALKPVFDQMQKMLNLFPSSNVNGFGVGGQNFNFTQSLSGVAPRREDLLRVDFQINSKNRLYGRWLHNSDDSSVPFVTSGGAGPFGTFACDSDITFKGGCTQRHPGWNFSANLVSTITPTILNEFSVGPSHTLSIDSPVGNSIQRGAQGITLPLYYPVDNTQAIPDLSFGGLGNVNFKGGYLGATPWYQANTTINVNDNLSWVRGRHTFKTGMFYQRSRKDQISWGNVNGQFNFNPGTYTIGSATYNLGDPLAAALLGFFTGFDQSAARPRGFFRYNQLEFYVQDTWKATARLTLDYGLRFAWIPPQYDARNQIALFDPASYDPKTAVTIDSGGNIVPGSGNPLDGMKYAAQGQFPQGGWDSRGIMPEPRLGFAYDMFNDHKTVLRGGFGMMHDRVQGNLIFNPVFSNPLKNPTAHVPAGNIADLQSLQATFQVQSDKNIIAAERSGKVPTVYSFSLGVQHEISRGTTLDLAYVGTLSRHLVTARDVNAVPYGYAFTAAAQNPANFPGGVVPAVEPNLPAIYSAAGVNFSGTYAYGHPSYTNAALVPYKGYGQIAGIGWGGTSNYNSLQASLQRRFTKGLTAGAVYTWSKALTTSTADGDYQNPVNALIGYRAASWDRTHVFAANYVYDLPGPAKHFGGPKWLSYLTDNYQLSGVTNVMTGAPISPNGYQGLNNGYGWNSGALDGSNQWGPNPYFYSIDKGGNLITPTVGFPPRATRDALRAGGMQNWDMSLFKNIPIRERYSIQLRLEAYNVFNHTNFNDKFYNVNISGPWQWTYNTPAGGGSTNPTISVAKDSNWGTPQDTYNSSGGPGGFRVVQLGAKFIF
jgi:hypothetical protein